MLEMQGEVEFDWFSKFSNTLNLTRATSLARQQVESFAPKQQTNSLS